MYTRGYAQQEKAMKSTERVAASLVWLYFHWREAAARRGVQAVAHQMRQQGIPCDVAIAILATK